MIASKVSEDAAEDNAAKCQPPGKWRPKINRNNCKNIPYMSFLSDKSDQKKPDVNGQNDSTGKKRIISLIKSAKNNPSTNNSTDKGKQTSTIIKLKGSSVNPKDEKIGNSGAIAISSSVDPPKKHTPIIWQQSVQSASNVALKVSVSSDPHKKKFKPITWP